MKPRVVFLIAVVASFLAVPASATTYLVCPDGGGDFMTIQQAIDAVANGDIIELCCDQPFTGDGNRDIDVLGKAITIRSECGDPERCIIDCEGSDVEPHRGFYFHTGETQTSVVEGVTITGGVCIVATPFDRGGAIFCDYAAPTIRNCILDDCGAIYTGGIYLSYSDALIEDCLFCANSSTSSGGAIRCYASSPIIRRCVFDSNSSTGGGAIECHGVIEPIIEWCTFTRNWGTAWGGAIFCTNHAHPRLANNTFYRNRCGGYAGGSGAGIALDPGTAATVTNSILWGDSLGTEVNEAWIGEGATLTITCCDIDVNGIDGPGALIWGGGNIVLDPQWCSTEHLWCEGGEIEEPYPYTLWSSSPCAPFSPPNEECDLIGAWPVGCWIPYHVCPDGSGDFLTIQEAIDAAVDGDTILLCCDQLFMGDGNRDIDFQGKAITVRSACGDPERCVINCEADSLNRHRGFWFHSGEDSTSILEDLQIAGGLAPGEPWSQRFGSGIFCDSSSPRFTNCIFAYNGVTDPYDDTYSGGGLACQYGSSPILDSCRFEGNMSYLGAGLSCRYDSSPKLTNCTFLGGFAHQGGVLWSEYSSYPTFEGCVFDSNRGFNGGAVYCRYESDPTFINCIFLENFAQSYGGAISGGTETSPIFAYCTFWENFTFGGGGGCSFYANCHPGLMNCTFSGNMAEDRGGGGIYCYAGASPTVQNTILWGDSTRIASGYEVYVDSVSSITFQCSDVDVNGIGGDGEVTFSGCNFFLDPWLCDTTNEYINPDGEPFKLHPDSPCMPGNHPDATSCLWCGLIGAWPDTCLYPWSGIEDAIERGAAPAVAWSAPNPFSAQTRLTYRIPAGSGDSHVSLDVCDVAGRLVRRLVEAEQGAGLYRTSWNGINQEGIPVAGGVYFFRLRVNGERQTRRAILVR
ncbi:right-handed parallel beta-helix repeat-containing protein [Candidatus Eisenbacteria bacterium]|uniref:Right-handed parallel beta-helix repeat-containing protein n=1 Tax=Eiseniibacteriota bacterium TaxID=2212470 RepID=A0ABV6YJY1_UNCEI